MKKTIIFGCCVLLISGCSSSNFKQGMYQGMQNYNQLQSTPVERVGKPDMNYDQYNSERNR